ncbi:MAG: translocation/assembly module TamB domain-containing protein, partial [Candidatus Aureabacteria bacterium]|nr:translocation/assembly module TamB domain-containing protein [Candidatus Auribacterota bacterium]
ESHSLEFTAARLSLPLSLLVFAGSSRDRRLDLQVFPSRLHMMDLAYLLPAWRAVQPDGILAVEGAVKGTWEQPEVSAFARWTEAVVGNLRLRNGEAEGEATVYPRGVGTTLTGFLRVVSGKVEVGGNSLAIKSARIFFRNRAVLDPDIDLLIEGRIGERLVTIAGEGTIAHPRIRLRSRPPLPEEEIFELLAAPPFAGKRPAPPPAARTSAQQLVDRLLLEVGGSATPSRRSWELAEVVYDPEKGKTGATVRASWTDRFSALYGLALRPSGIDQVLGVEYRLLDSLTIGQQQGFRLDGEAPIDDGGESKFYLRWKREF